MIQPDGVIAPPIAAAHGIPMAMHFAKADLRPVGVSLASRTEYAMGSMTAHSGRLSMSVEMSAVPTMKPSSTRDELVPAHDKILPVKRTASVERAIKQANAKQHK